MDFEYSTDTNLERDGKQVSRLLYEVYVDGGFTEKVIAEALFNSKSIFDRGTLFVARKLDSSEIVGTVILVTSDSKACRLAKENEAEIHLLAVGNEYRGQGVARSLVNAAITRAKELGKAGVVLWTQETMKEARFLYKSLGFNPVKDFTQNAKNFTLFQLTLVE